MATATIPGRLADILREQDSGGANETGIGLQRMPWPDLLLFPDGLSLNHAVITDVKPLGLHGQERPPQVLIINVPPLLEDKNLTITVAYQEVKKKSRG